MGRRRFPRLAWMAGYQRTWLRGDVLAGITITAYLVPQVMAYAGVAGLPPVVGLWASVGALLAYAALGSSPQLSVGPESTTALMTAAALASLHVHSPDRYADFASALCLVVAALCLLGWLGRLAVLAELLSRPVLVGYMSGVAVVMIASQLGKLGGFTVEADGFLPQVRFFASHLHEVQVPTLVLGGVTLALLVLASTLFPRAPVALLGMMGAAGAVSLLGLRARGVDVIGEIPAGLPVPSLPHVSVSDVARLLPSALGVAVVGYTDNILTGRAFAARRRESIDPKRELLALGAANLGSGLMHGFPVSSSGSRTAIGDAVGGRTQLTSLATVGATVLAILTLRPVLALFPTAALGAVVTYAALRLIDVGEFRRLARFRRSELLIALATTVLVLVVGVLQGVLVAVGLSILDLLRRVARPHDAIEGLVPDVAGMHDVDDYPDARTVPGLVVFRYDAPLFFVNAEDFRRASLAAVTEYDRPATPVRWLVLNVEANMHVDVTAARALARLHRDLAGRGVTLGLVRVKHDLQLQLERAGLLTLIPPDMIFPTLPTMLAAYWSRFPDARDVGDKDQGSLAH
jgi:sulfate permease, SulP family